MEQKIVPTPFGILSENDFRLQKVAIFRAFEVKKSLNKIRLLVERN